MNAQPTDLPVLLPLRRAAIACEWGSADTVKLFSSLKFPIILITTGVLCLASVQAASDAELRPGIVETVLKWTPLIWSGFLFNLLVSVASMALGTAVGFALGLGQVSLRKPVRDAAWAITQFFRNAPWLVLLFFAMFLLPFELRLGTLIIPLPAWLKAVVGLSLPVMANVAEIVRGGIGSIPSGQWESAESLAFSRMQTLWQIVIPQAVKRMIPPWMNLYAILTMATTLISVVGIQDSMTLTRAALVAEARTDLYLPFYFLLLLLFFAYCYPIARLTLLLERRYAVAA
jgi:polar amino acid transport system permease protein